jgi:hypothetical protein
MASGGGGAQPAAVLAPVAAGPTIVLAFGRAKGRATLIGVATKITDLLG